MSLHQRNGIWYLRKMVDGVLFNRSTKTDDKKLAEQIQYLLTDNAEIEPSHQLIWLHEIYRTVRCLRNVVD